MTYWWVVVRYHLFWLQSRPQCRVDPIFCMPTSSPVVSSFRSGFPDIEHGYYASAQLAGGTYVFALCVCLSIHPSVRLSVHLSIWISFRGDNSWTTDRNNLKMRYCTMYLKMKSWVVLWRLSNSRWLTERNVYTNGCFLYIFIKEWDIDLKIGMYVDWCSPNDGTPIFFAKIHKIANFS